jgi:hypothetical protein
MCELTFSGTTSVLSNAQRGVVEAFVSNGGHVVWVSENSISGNAPGSNQSMTAISNLWGINLNRVANFSNPCVPYHPGPGPGSLCANVTAIGTTSSYDYFTGPSTLHQNCVLAGSGGNTSCTQGNIRGMAFLFENPYICNFNGTITLYGEVQMWSSLMGTGQYAIHQSNVAYLHHSIMTGNTAAINTINTNFTPNPNCTAPSPCSVFSVELSGFVAEAISDNDAELVWWTESESMNKGFDVEQALPTDGDPEFKKIGWVDGAGFTDEQQMYKFPVEDLVPGTHQFRLRIVDEQGQTEYSEVRSLFVNGQEEPELFPTAWEKGISSMLTVYWPLSETANVQVVDLQGRQVARLFDGVLEAGNNTIAIQPETMAAGTYLLRVTGQTKQAVERIIVM